MTSTWIGILVLLLLVVVFVAPRFTRTVVLEYERGLKFSRGRFKGVVGPGLYWRSTRFTEIRRIDVRPSRVVIAGQEVLSADGVAIKASVAATVAVKDPERALLKTDNYQIAIHTELQLALRAVVSSLPVEELLKRRTDIATELKAIAGPRLDTLGIELQDASLRDLTFPGELKKIFAQVVKARQDGLAALEKARGETAALRSLANAASMIERNPSLMPLRALQTLAEQPGNTLVLGMQQNAPIIPLRSPETPPLQPPPASPPDLE
jgi:regulator of protease activity HflC (stomatin/prohibitin superfamily)